MRAAFAVVLASRALAVHAEPRVEAGGYAGATSTNVYTTYTCPSPPDPMNPCVTASRPHDGRLGIALGGYVRYALVPGLELEAHLLYAQKGWGGADSVGIHYLEAPILLRVDSAPITAPARVVAFAGVAPALELWCHESGTRFASDVAVPYSDACGSWTFDPRSPNRFDVSAVVGGGVGWQLSPGVIELQVRYEEGLVDNGTSSEGGKTVNRAVYVLAGYSRALGAP